MPKLRKLAKKLGIALASVGLFLVVGEVVARAAEPGPFTFFDRYPYEDAGVLGQERHVPGFEGRWDSTWYDIDARGFRGSTPDPTMETGELRLVCVGDSCTFGKGVLEEDSWPRQLETKLREASEDSKVYNLGINGAHGAVYEALLEEHLGDLAPHAVVVGYNINDFPNALQAIDAAVFQERGLRRIFSQDVRDAFGRSALYRKVRAIYYDLQKERDLAASEEIAKQAASNGIDEGVWERERGYLERMRDLCAAEGAPLVVFLFPYESQVLLANYDRGPIERMATLCGDLGVPFVDLAEEFREVARAGEESRSLFIPGDRYHPNAEGYAIVADKVVDELRALGIVEGP